MENKHFLRSKGSFRTEVGLQGTYKQNSISDEKELNILQLGCLKKTEIKKALWMKKGHYNNYVIH